MSAIEPSSARAGAVISAESVASVAAAEAEPGDALAALLVSLEAVAGTSAELAETRVGSTLRALEEQLQVFLRQAREAAQALEKAKDGGGWFSDLMGGVADLLGRLVGTAADAGLQIDTLVCLVDGLCSGRNVLEVLRDSALEAIRNGETADSVGGFTAGVTRFGADLCAFGLTHDVGELVQSLERNVLDNPAFWQVVSAAAKGAAVAGAIVTGGAAAVAAVALIAVLELDRRTGLIEKTVGAEAAPYVRLGLELGAAVCLGAASYGSDPGGAIRLLRSSTTALNGVNGLYQGYRAATGADREADALELGAGRLETLQRMQWLTRLLDELVRSLERDGEARAVARELGAELGQTRASTERALVVPA